MLLRQHLVELWYNIRHQDCNKYLPWCVYRHSYFCKCRADGTYNGTTLNTQTGWTFSTGSIPESEYEISTIVSAVTPSGGLITLTGGLGLGLICLPTDQLQQLTIAVLVLLVSTCTEPPATGRITHEFVINLIQYLHLLFAGF